MFTFSSYSQLVAAPQWSNGRDIDTRSKRLIRTVSVRIADQVADQVCLRALLIFADQISFSVLLFIPERCLESVSTLSPVGNIVLSLFYSSDHLISA